MACRGCQPFIGRERTPSQLGHDFVCLQVAKRDEHVQSFGTLGFAATAAGHSALHFWSMP
jgi:hypothetical protein